MKFCPELDDWLRRATLKLLPSNGQSVSQDDAELRVFPVEFFSCQRQNSAFCKGWSDSRRGKNASSIQPKDCSVGGRQRTIC
ncbi:MAG: hypothetical protein DWH78_04040 [Planctomycetota bacterium]|nr:MAG: hypothetical protein DWH78_04040 [Planctomycetota bacterium]